MNIVVKESEYIKIKAGSVINLKAGDVFMNGKFNFKIKFSH